MVQEFLDGGIETANERQLGLSLYNKVLEILCSIETIIDHYYSERYNLLHPLITLQQILIMLSTTVTYPAMMAKALCIGEDDYLIRSELIGTIFFASGICTLLQTTIGVR